MNLVYKSVSDFGKIITGKTPATSKTELWDGEIPFITPTDIDGYDMHYIFETERTISNLGANKQKSTVLPKNTICVSCIASIGKMCITSANKSISNQQINSIIVNNNYDFRYIFYLLRYFLPYIQLIGGGTGSGTPIISKGKFSKMKYPVCESPNFQKRVADILSVYDSLIEINNKRIRVLEQMAENLYKEWFIRFRFPGHEIAEFENGVPKAWQIKRIGDLVHIKSGYAFKSEWWIDEGVPVIKIKDISDNTIDKNNFSRVSIEHANIAPQFYVSPGDLLIALTGATIGKIGIVSFGEKMTVNQRVGKFFLGEYPDDNVGFWFCLFQQEEIQKTIMAYADSNAAQPNISPSDIERIKIVFSKTVLDSFNNRVKPVIRQILKLRKLTDNLIQQRDLLLPRLMSGKLEVKNVSQL